MFSEESIYNIIPPKVVQVEKPPMYRSQHSGKIPPTASTFGHVQTTHPICTNIAGSAAEKIVPVKASRTMGKAPGNSKNHAENFMKKGDKQVASLADVKKQNPETLQPSTLKPKLKPDVPKKEEQPVMNLVTSKNFVVSNAVETILAAPKKTSQSAKDYLQKEDYGKVPKYLSSIKQDIEAEYDYIRQLQQQQDFENSERQRPLNESERVTLIDGLKTRWEQVNTEYQASTHITKLDTVGKVNRKEKYEAELTQIEKDIEKLNRKNLLVDMSY